MIYAFTGKTGSGKSFKIVEYVYKDWLNGRDVYSNIPLSFEKFAGVAGGNIIDNPEGWTRLQRIKFKLIHTINKNCYVPHRGRIIYFEQITDILEARQGDILFDEAQVLFNARSWESIPLEFQYKLQQHRKHDLDLFATMQTMKTVAIEYRRLVQMWYHFTDKFALLGRRNPSLFTIHTMEEKDVDKLYENDVDVLKVETVKLKRFFIHRFKRRYYDTLFTIGFKRLRTICKLQYDLKTKKWKKRNMIVPKNMSLSDVQKRISSLQSILNPKKFQYSKKN